MEPKPDDIVNPAAVDLWNQRTRLDTLIQEAQRLRDEVTEQLRRSRRENRTHHTDPERRTTR